MIKTIFCDLGNVLVNVNRPKAFQLLTELTGLPPEMLTSPEAVALEIAFECGQIDEQAYFQQIQIYLSSNHKLTLNDLVQLWQQPFEMNWEVWQFIQRLRQKVAVIILSNTNPLHIRAIRQKYQIFDQVDGHVLSYEVGAIKPNAAIYHAALSKARITAAEALFIDDLPENVAAAQALGIQAHQYTNLNSLQRFIKEQGITF